MVRKVRPDHEEILLDGTAQSVRFGETLRDRSGRPDNINSQEVARPQNFVMGNDETELDLSVKSRSFVIRVNDQVRKRQKRISNVAGDGEEHSMIWGMFMSVTMETAVFIGKNFENNQNTIVNTADLTLKHMFDISAKLVTEQDEISGLETIGWEKHSWKCLSLIGDERIINLQRTKVYVLSDSVLCLGKIHQNPDSNEPWKKRVEWITSSQSYRNFDGIDGEPTEFERNIFPGKDNEEECLAHAKVVFLYARKFGTGQWSFISPGPEKKWHSMKEDSPQGIWDNITEKMLLEFAESSCPIFRATTPLSRCKLKSKGHGKLSIHFGATQETIETIFRIIVSANQLSLYGAVAEMCEEHESLHDRSGRPDKVMGQSIVLSEIKAEVSLENDDPAYQNFLLQRYEERIKSLPQTDRVSKFCMDAGFISVVEVGQYFMTKDNEEQFYAKACREYTLPRNDGSSQPKGWIQGNTKIGPVLEVTTSYLWSKYGVEIRIWSLSGDNTHSWVRLSHG